MFNIVSGDFLKDLLNFSFNSIEQEFLFGYF
jgi:hypothetical protein